MSAAASNGRFAGRTALVTGATRHTGLAIAEAFVREGARVFLNGRNPDDVAREVARLRRQYNGDVVEAAADLSRQEAIDALFARVESEGGRLDVLVNNAVDQGVGHAFTETPRDWLEEVFRVNVFGTFACSQGAARIMLKFIADMEAKTGWLADELDLGGGFGVRYVKEDKGIDIASAIRELAGVINAECTELGIQRPRIMLEPGRSIVADAGITLYTVGSVKTIPGFRTYVSVDGGMPDNPRYALYQSRYEAVIANRAAEPKTIHCTIAGRCCESGDLIGENMPLQETSRGDILAVFVTGAYNYSMASNYNRLTRPPIIMVKDGKSYTAVRRESFEDLTRNDL